VTRPLHVIAQDIRKNWPNIYFGAKPYVDALGRLHSITDPYGAEDARSIVLYFLANAGTWRGEDARRVKAELKNMIR
jgi:hypothetical protein